MKVQTNVKSGVTEGCGCGATTITNNAKDHNRPPTGGPNL